MPSQPGQLEGVPAPGRLDLLVLRHLIMAADCWLKRGIELEQVLPVRREHRPEALVPEACLQEAQ